mmetsp:Transcript_17572/g.44845  ORF Transcript_17572/g.44845 Transcript_17572/m.44845 type:complete len:223 (-) Transcript_17572:215-883(-)
MDHRTRQAVRALKDAIVSRKGVYDHALFEEARQAKLKLTQEAMALLKTGTRTQDMEKVNNALLDGSMNHRTWETETTEILASDAEAWDTQERARREQEARKTAEKKAEASRLAREQAEAARKAAEQRAEANRRAEEQAERDRREAEARARRMREAREAAEREAAAERDRARREREAEEARQQERRRVTAPTGAMAGAAGGAMVAGPVGALFGGVFGLIVGSS